MPRVLKVLASASLVLLACVGCQQASPGISVSISGQFRDTQGGTIDLAKAYDSDWDRACVLGPYSTNATARTTLGFDWDADGKTVIHRNDGVALLLFVRGDKVVAFAEHPRNLGDFAHLSGQCFERAKARFYQRRESAQGPAGLFPKAAP